MLSRKEGVLVMHPGNASLEVDELFLAGSQGVGWDPAPAKWRGAPAYPRSCPAVAVGQQKDLQPDVPAFPGPRNSQSIVHSIAAFEARQADRSLLDGNAHTICLCSITQYTRKCVQVSSATDHNEPNSNTGADCLSQQVLLQSPRDDSRLRSPLPSRNGT